MTALTIDRLRLHLPSGFERRAEQIGRLLGEALARIEHGSSLAIDHLALPPVAVARDASNAEIATRIADAVRVHLARHEGDR